MPNLTLTITDEMKADMKKHPSVRWSNAVRVSIEKKLRDFELAEKLAQRSRNYKKYMGQGKGRLQSKKITEPQSRL